MTSDAAPPAPPSIPDSLRALLAGTSYRPLGLLGKGAQGFVLDAVHVALGKPVVIKVPHAKHGLDRRITERVELEAQALARMSSPHLVGVHDFGVLSDGRPFFVMEKLHGRTLKAEVRERGPLPVAEAIAIARQVLAALAVVHHGGLVHRDVKPDNVFLCDGAPGGERLVKLLDFGVAKVVPGSAGAVVSALAPTMSGIAIGTPRFLSPEQARGTPIDARADLYAVGVLLFWMLCGRDPFSHHTDITAVLMAHAIEPPPKVSTIATTTIPITLEDAIHRALRKQPEERFASARAFDAVLAAIDPQAAVVPIEPATIRMRGAVGGGTVRMALPSARPTERLAPQRQAGPLPNTPSPLPMVSSARAAALVVAACATLTLLLLLGARLVGWM